MKKTLFIFFILHSSFFIASAQDTLFKHVYWQAYGSHSLEYFGFNGLDTIGYVNDTVKHALSIGEDAGAAFVLNRKPLDSLHPDTAPVYRFPGQKVVRGDINGDGIPDFVIHDATARRITVLFGTDIINKFDTALVLQGDINKNEFGDYTSIAVANFNSSQYDGIVISDLVYTEDMGHNDIGRMLYYRGGVKIDSTPTMEIKGTSNTNSVGGELAIGHIRDSTKRYLAEERVLNGLGKDDTVGIILYPLGANFQLVPTDTIILNTDSSGGLNGGYVLTDVFGRGIDDIVLGGALKVLIYRGGQSISPQPTSYLSNPSHLISDTYGQLIVNVGHTVNPNYESILVCDPQAGLGNAGAVYLFNMGKALKDTVVAEATMDNYSFAQFGAQAIGIGSYNAQELANFMVSDQLGPSPFPNNGNGHVTVFLGESSYGPLVGVREDGTIPRVFLLSQNYPNPSSGETHIDFSVLDSRLYGSTVTLELYNEFGERVETLYRGAADNVIRSLHFNAEDLPSGNYFYRLVCGGRETTRMMTKMN